MNLKDAINGRRSIRIFKEDLVSDKSIKEIIKAGMMAPSACNRQHWHFIIIKDKKVKQTIYEECGSQKTILKAPVSIAVCYNHELNREHSSNIQSVAAAVQNMSLRAHDLGLGSTWIAGFGDWKSANRILGLPKHLRIMCVLVVGKPEKLPPPPRRKPIEEVVSYERYAGARHNLPKTMRASKWSMKEVRENQKLVYRARERNKDREPWGNDDINFMGKTLRKHLVRKNMHVMQLFAYDGTILRGFVDLFKEHRFQTCELTEEASSIIQYKFPDTKCIVYDKEIPLKDNSLDLIFATFSLEKVPEKRKILREARRVLKPNGKLIVFFKNKLSLYGLTYFAWDKIGINMQDNSIISPDPFEPITSIYLNKIMKRIGFSTKMKAAYFYMPEIEVYHEKFDGFQKRFGETFKFKKLVGFSLKAGTLLYKITKKLRLPIISSTMYIIGTKKS